MESIAWTSPVPAVGSGFSVVLAERVLRQADLLDLPAAWDPLGLGHPSGRASAYPARHRLAAVLAGLACGLRGIGPGNTFLRPNSALQARLGGRFPDQGTIHRWLAQVTPEQAGRLRGHLHDVVRTHGRFWQVLWSEEWLVVDVDGQGLVARGRRFQRAAVGYLGPGLDCGYIRYVAYAGATGEVLDEFLAPGNKTLMSQLPELLAGLNAVIPRPYRARVVVRGDAHLGTIGNLRALRQDGYHYLCPLQSWSAARRLRAAVQGRRGGRFEETDSDGRRHRVQFWVVPRWRLSGKGRQRRLVTRATVYCDRVPGQKERWTVLVSDLKREKGRRLWQRYHGRGGTIEEYNDQAERAYHLEVVRSGHFDGLNALHALIGLCWDLTRWATEELRLPPLQAPQAERAAWVAVAALDLSAVAARAAHSGLRLYREGPGAALEVEDTAGTAESLAWRQWLQQPIQLRLRLTG
jgi:Transposase DDE domain group 1